MKLKMLVLNKERNNILHSKLYSYNSSPTLFNKYKINDLIFNKKKRLVSIFKDHLIFDDHSEFLNSYYLKSISEIYFKIFLISKEFYTKDFVNFKINKIMINNIQSKLNIKKRKNSQTEKKIAYNSINIRKNIEKQSESTTLKNSLYYPSKENSKTIDLEYKGDYNKELYLSNNGSKIQKEESIISFYKEDSLFQKKPEIKILKVLSFNFRRNNNKNKLKEKKYNNNKTVNKLNKKKDFSLNDHLNLNKTLPKKNPSTKTFYPIKLQFKSREKKNSKYLNEIIENDSHTNFSSNNTQKSSFVTTNSNKSIHMFNTEKKNIKNKSSKIKKRKLNLNSYNKVQQIFKKNTIKLVNNFNYNNNNHYIRNFSLNNICKTEISKEDKIKKHNLNNIKNNNNGNNKSEKKIKNKSINSSQFVPYKSNIKYYSKVKKDKKSYFSLIENNNEKPKKLKFFFPGICNERIKLINKIIKK